MELEARSQVQLQPEVCQAWCGGWNSNCLHKCGRLESPAMRTGPLGLLWLAVPLLHRQWASVLTASSAKQVSPVCLAVVPVTVSPSIYRYLPRGGGSASPVSLQLGDTGGWGLKSRGPWDGPGLSSGPLGRPMSQCPPGMSLQSGGRLA